MTSSYRVSEGEPSSSAVRPAYAGVTGLIAWLIILATAVGVFAYPRLLLGTVVIYVGYLLCRTVVTVVFNAVGTLRARAWTARDWAAEPITVGPDGLLSSEVHHIVMVPNYREPETVLRRTLTALAEQNCARERLTVVLAMEQKEESAQLKAAALSREFEGSFARLLVTMHPAGLPGETPGKGSNEAWASREARRAVVDEGGVPIECVTITSCDADSRLHPSYLAALERHFAASPHRYSRFWQAPILYHNNIWEVPGPVRFIAYFSHALQMSELANPLYRPMPISTYSLALALAERADYWDPAIISEDWNMYLRCMLANGGDLRLTPIFLPTSADATDGETPFRALVNRYHQTLRHAWGAEDAGYLIREWPRARDVPALTKGLRLAQVIHDHLLRSVSWFLLLAGSVLTGTMHSSGAMTLVAYGQFPLALRVLYAAGSVAMVALVATEFFRYPPPDRRSIPKHLMLTVITWVTMPFFSFVLGTLPALTAQTRLLLGGTLEFRVTPKRLAEPYSEAA